MHFFIDIIDNIITFNPYSPNYVTSTQPMAVQYTGHMISVCIIKERYRQLIIAIQDMNCFLRITIYFHLNHNHHHLLLSKMDLKVTIIIWACNFTTSWLTKIKFTELKTLE